jgi:hypothetical protein
MEGFIADPKLQDTFTSAESMAAGMYRVATSGTIPLRAPLSEPAWTVVKAACDDVMKELDETKELCFGVNNEGLDKTATFLRDSF